MSAAEIAWRSAQAGPGRGCVTVRPEAVAARRTLSSSRAHGRLPPASTRRASVPASAASALARSADSLLAGRLGHLGASSGRSQAPDWFLDPVQGRHAPERPLRLPHPAPVREPRPAT